MRPIKAKKQNKISRFLTEHAAALVIAAIALVSIILVIIVFTLLSSGKNERKLVIEDITGSAFILRGDGQMPAGKKVSLESGDVIITSSDGEVMIAADKDKYIYIEPSTTLYVYYTETEGSGSIIVNISEGAAICRLDSKLPKNSAFEVRTPNAVVSAAGTVFRTKFEYYESYGGYSSVKLTEAECAQGEVNIQLYDNNASPADQLMLLAEGKSARLLTCGETARYEYLNNITDLYTLSPEAVKAYMRISAERPLVYSQAELNLSYRNTLGGGTETSVSTMYPVPDTEESFTENEEPQFSAAQITTSGPHTTPSPDTQTSAGTPEDISSDTTASSVTSVPDGTSAPETTTTVSTPISVPETTTRIYTVTTAQTTTLPPVTTTTAPTTTLPPVTTTTAPTTTLPPVTTTTAPATTLPPVTTTTAPATTLPPVTTTTVPPIKPAEPVTEPSESTSSFVSYTASEETETSAYTTRGSETSSSSTVPWWEIINSGALE